MLRPVGLPESTPALAGAGGGASLGDPGHDAFERSPAGALPGRHRGGADNAEPPEVAAQVIRSWMSEA